MSRTLNRTRRKKSRLSLTFLVALGLPLALPAASRAEDQPIAQQIRETFGLNSFGQIEAMRYTWNAELPGGHQLSNKWEWSPKTNTVSYVGKDKQGNTVKVTYQRSQPAVKLFRDAVYASLKNKLPPDVWDYPRL